jgi:hypothetical protein
MYTPAQKIRVLAFSSALVLVAAGSVAGAVQAGTGATQTNVRSSSCPCNLGLPDGPRLPGPAVRSTRAVQLRGVTASAATAPDIRQTDPRARGYRFITDTLGGNGAQPASAQSVLGAVKRSSPNQVGLAWQYLRDTGQIAQTTSSSLCPCNLGLPGGPSLPRLTGAATAPGIRQTDPRASGPFTTDTLGGDGHRAAVKGYRIITDTLGGNGGPTRGQLAAGQASSTSSGFDWADASVGAGLVAGLGAIALGAVMIARRRHRLQTA